MIDLGYMAKRIVTRPDWLDVPSVRDICAVSNCISEDFCDYIHFWRHNGFWFFNSPADINLIATQEHLNLASTTLLYYTAHQEQYDADNHCWTSFSADPAFDTHVTPPKDTVFLGFDIVTYSMQTMPECSPLSCNHIASDVTVNEHCLMDSLDDALQVLESGLFDNSEPGPYRIIGVSRVGAVPDA